MSTYKYEVAMTCEGCATAVKNVVGKVKGVSAVNCDVKKKEVTVQSSAEVTQKDIDAAMKKTGKKYKFLNKN